MSSTTGPKSMSVPMRIVGNLFIVPIISASMLLDSKKLVHELLFDTHPIYRSDEKSQVKNRSPSNATFTSSINGVRNNEDEDRQKSRFNVTNQPLANGEDNLEQPEKSSDYFSDHNQPCVVPEIDAFSQSYFCGMGHSTYSQGTFYPDEAFAIQTSKMLEINIESYLRKTLKPEAFLVPACSMQSQSTSWNSDQGGFSVSTLVCQFRCQTLMGCFRIQLLSRHSHRSYTQH